MAQTFVDSSGEDFAIAQQQSKGAAIYDALRRDILTLALRPGEKVSEQILSERYNVGKGPIRLALARLSQDGLIVNRQRSGHAVSSITFDSIKNIYQMRLITLPAASYHAAGNGTIELKAAYEAVSAMEGMISSADDMFNFCVANRNFIVEIGRATGNSLLADSIEVQEDRCMRIQFFGTRSLHETHAVKSEYDKIWNAIDVGDKDLARTATAEALQLSEQRIIAAFLKIPELREMNLGDLIVT